MEDKKLEAIQLVFKSDALKIDHTTFRGRHCVVINLVLP